MEEKESKMKLKLWVGNMTGDKEGILKMWSEGQDFSLEIPNPKIFYAFDIPLIWFWCEFFNEGEEEPNLPNVFDESKFRSFIFDADETIKILKL